MVAVHGALYPSRGPLGALHCRPRLLELVAARRYEESGELANEQREDERYLQPEQRAQLTIVR